VTDDEYGDETADDSISGRSAALYCENNPSLASLLVSHGIRVREFILLSFLADQGPMSVTQLSHAVSIEPEIMLTGMNRLSAAGLIVLDPKSIGKDTDSVAKLTTRGRDVARRIDVQL
jgi:DNA-binding MarR family transcriptional regulator